MCECQTNRQNELMEGEKNRRKCAERGGEEVPSSFHWMWKFLSYQRESSAAHFDWPSPQKTTLISGNHDASYENWSCELMKSWVMMCWIGNRACLCSNHAYTGVCQVLTDAVTSALLVFKLPFSLAQPVHTYTVCPRLTLTSSSFLLSSNL